MVSGAWTFGHVTGTGVTRPPAFADAGMTAMGMRDGSRWDHIGSDALRNVDMRYRLRTMNARTPACAQMRRRMRHPGGCAAHMPPLPAL